MLAIGDIMFLLKLSLSSYKVSLLNDSGLSGGIDRTFEHWIDGYITNLEQDRASFDPHAIYDGVYNSIYVSNAQKAIVISNDPLGQRPLYYRKYGNELYVGSCFWEVLNAAPTTAPSGLDEDVLTSLLALRRIVPSHRTLHREISVLPAGSKLVNDGGSDLKLVHVVSMQQVEDELISVQDAATELKINMQRGLSRIKESGKYQYFWFGNSGGLDSRVIPAMSKEVGLECRGFLVSGDRIRGLKNLSKVGSEKVADKYKIENRFIDYTSRKCSNLQRIMADIVVNPFGPANYHKNPDFVEFRDSLVVNGGNSFLIANDNGSWKRYLGKGKAALNGYSNDLLIRKNRGRITLYEETAGILEKELESVLDLSDGFSICRTLHQKYLNKTSPMGAFESMSWAGEFHYLYYNGIGTLYRHWPKELFFDRKVQRNFMESFYPELLNIADQSGIYPGAKKKATIQLFLSKLRGNGLSYGLWLRSRWFRELLSEVKNHEIIRNNSRARYIINKVGEFDSPQDNLDMVKLALVTGMIEGGLSPRELI